MMLMIIDKSQSDLVQEWGWRFTFKKTLKCYRVLTFTRSVFHYKNKYDPQE